MSKEIAQPKLNASVLERTLAAGVAGLMAAGAFAVRYFEPTTASFYPACPLLKLTGIACPGCGLTRGFHALFHGDILGALDFNLIIPGFLFFFGYVLVSQILTAVRGRGLSFGIFNQKVIWGFFIIAVVFSVLRNLPFYPFSLLYP